MLLRLLSDKLRLVKCCLLLLLLILMLMLLLLLLLLLVLLTVVLLYLLLLLLRGLVVRMGWIVMRGGLRSMLPDGYSLLGSERVHLLSRTLARRRRRALYLTRVWTRSLAVVAWSESKHSRVVFLCSFLMWHRKRLARLSMPAFPRVRVAHWIWKPKRRLDALQAVIILPCPHLTRLGDGQTGLQAAMSVGLRHHTTHDSRVLPMSRGGHGQWNDARAFRHCRGARVHTTLCLRSWTDRRVWRA